ncbi:beta-xylosidase 1 [Euphorbia peplus]|nr:beta-xylosidase 1 [Euphorbia peplus]
MNFHNPPLFFFFFLILFLSISAKSKTQPPFSCDSSNPSTESYPFCKTSLPITERAKDVVSRLTLDEKISQLVDTVPGIPRLGIPTYRWWSEALHGVAFLRDVSDRMGIHFNGTIKSATSFPQVILSAASFDTRLWYRIGQATGIEARAIYNVGQAIGMTFWAPNINVFRDPRWGRGQETPGEDPFVTGKYAVSFVRGVQGDTFEGGKLGNQLQASACCKHFTAYDLDKWNGTNRFIFNAKVTLQDLADTYQPPFQSCIQEGKASGIMCAYNQVNGVPNCADYNLLSRTARGKWSFNGYITSDCDAVSIIYDTQGYAKTPEDAVADVLKAGMDVNCGNYLKNYTKSAVQKKKVSVADIDRALHNLFSIRMRLGLFDGNPSRLPYGHIGADQVCSKEHQDIALEAARDGIVLLKNSKQQLPLSKLKTTSLAVIGPNADNSSTLVGNYAGPPCKTVTPLQGLQSYIKNTRYHPGCSTVACPSATIDQAVRVAKNADQVVLIMGLDQTQEREEQDRVDLLLPGKQHELIISVARAAKKPVILVLLCGGPVDISFAKYNSKIGSILWVGYPGEAGGTALAEIIFGDHNPGGRLPMTWYPQEFTKVPMTDMRMRPQKSSGYPGRTYRFYQGKKVFEFGHGLSYSSYSYKFVSVKQNSIYLRSPSSDPSNRDLNQITYRLVSDIGSELCENSKLSVTVRVENEGDMAGKHPVLLYVKQSEVGNGNPVKKLVGFQSIKLNAGKNAEIEYKLSPCEHLSRANEEGLMVMDAGSQYLLVGDKEHMINVRF